jgi:hypothetical protein
MPFELISIIVLLIYLASLFVCVVECVIENRRLQRRRDLWFYVGILTSAAWPLVVSGAMLRILWIGLRDRIRAR